MIGILDGWDWVCAMMMVLARMERWTGGEDGRVWMQCEMGMGGLRVKKLDGGGGGVMDL